MRFYTQCTFIFIVQPNILFELFCHFTLVILYNNSKSCGSQNHWSMDVERSCLFDSLSFFLGIHLVFLFLIAVLSNLTKHPKA